MSRKQVLTLLIIGSIVAMLDHLGIVFDLEPGEPGYNTYGGLGAMSFLLAFPFCMPRYLFFILIASLFFSGDPQALSKSLGGFDPFESPLMIWPWDVAMTFLYGAMSFFFLVRFRRKRA